MPKDFTAKSSALPAAGEASAGAASATTLRDVWRARLKRVGRFWRHVGRAFVQNRCPVRAAALAYASLLALVPMLAVVASVSAALLKRQGEEPVEKFVESLVAYVAPAVAADTRPAGSPVTREDVQLAATRKEMARRINEFISNIRSGAIGVAGTVALVIVAIMMLARVEDTLNDIWGVTRGRHWLVRIGNYWASLTLGPLLLITALGLSSSARFAATKAWFSGVPSGFIEHLSFVMEVILPFLIVTTAFTLCYVLLPNTRVSWRAALAGGLVGAALWQLNNFLSVLYVSQVAVQSKIYGSVGMVPVLMAGLYFAWTILLLGGQVAHAFQHQRSLEQEAAAAKATPRDRELLALRLMARIGERFQHGEPPLTRAALAMSLSTSERLAGGILASLTESKLLVEVPDTDSAYTPARPLETITCHDLLAALRGGTQTRGANERVTGAFDRLVGLERDAASAITVADLIGAKPPETKSGA